MVLNQALKYLLLTKMWHGLHNFLFSNKYINQSKTFPFYFAQKFQN